MTHPGAERRAPENERDPKPRTDAAPKDRTMKTFAVPVLLLVSVSCVGVAPPSTLSPSSDGASPSWSKRIVSPVSAPTTFETPAIESEIRPMFLHQELPESSAFSGGNFQLYAVQARVALSDRLAFIATKDGYIDFNPDAGTDEEGFADIAVGLKYAVVDDHEHGVLVTPGLIYEVDSGDHEVFQGNGDGLIRPFVSAAWDQGELHVLGAVGLNQPFHGSAETTSLDYHAQAAYEVDEGVFPLVEVHGITYLDNGNAAPFAFEGGDLINLGSNNVRGNSVFSMAAGGRVAISDDVQFGATYEFPLGGRRDLMDWRVTCDFIWRF